MLVLVANKPVKASLSCTSNVMKKFSVTSVSVSQDKNSTNAGSFGKSLLYIMVKLVYGEQGIIVKPDAFGEKLSVWASSQAHELRNTIAETLGVQAGNIDVKACDIGGGFGCKFMVYSEEICVAAVAKFLEQH